MCSLSFVEKVVWADDREQFSTTEYVKDPETSSGWKHVSYEKETATVNMISAETMDEGAGDGDAVEADGEPAE